MLAINNKRKEWRSILPYPQLQTNHHCSQAALSEGVLTCSNVAILPAIVHCLMLMSIMAMLLC